MKSLICAFAATALWLFAATAEADQAVPEIVTSEATLWLDATDLESGEIESWSDVRGYDYYTATTYSGVASPTVIKIASGALAGKKAVSFGTVGTKCDLTFPRHQTRTAFFVMDIDQSPVAALLGDNSDYGFIRGANGAYVFNEPATADKGSYNASVWNDGVGVAAPRTTLLPTGYQLITWQNDARFVSRLTNDRDLEGFIGGKRLCELILFNRKLTHGECLAIECYLRTKWYGETRNEDVAFYRHFSGLQVLFDASVADSFHYEVEGDTAKTKVTQWDDLSGNNNHLVCGTFNYGTRTTANNFFPAYDMGTKGSLIDLQLTTRLTNTRSVFMVCDIQDANDVVWLGDDSVYEFIRGASGQYVYDQSPKVGLFAQGTVYKNGVKIADLTNDHPDPTGVTSLYSLLVNKDCAWRFLAKDRNIYVQGGGKKVSELVTFNRVVTDDERVEIENHILKHWKTFVTVPEPLLHVDASDPNNFITNANGQITAWKNTGTVAGDFFKPERLYGYSNTFIPCDCQFGALRYVGGRPVFDMGAVGSNIELCFPSAVDSIRTVCWAMDIADSVSAFFLGTPLRSTEVYDNWYDFHRGSNGEYAQSANAAAMWKTAAISVDGKLVSGGNAMQKPPAGYHVYEAVATSALRAGGLSQDRWCQDGNTHRNGGRQISELVIYDVPLGGIAGLKLAETLDLKQKWNTLGGWVGPSEWGDGKCRRIEQDETVPDGTNSVAGLFAAASVTLSGDGTVNIGEAGLLVADGVTLTVNCDLIGNFSSIYGGGKVITSRLNLSEQNGVFDLPAAMGFADAVTIDLGARELELGEKVVTWETKPANVDSTTFQVVGTGIPSGTTVSVLYDGLYLCDPNLAVDAYWTGAADDDDVGNSANWACTNGVNAEIAGGLPCEKTIVHFAGSCVPARITSASQIPAAKYIVSASLAADADWSGLDLSRIDVGGHIDLKGHKLTIDVSNGNFANTFAVTDSTTDAGHPGEFHINVADSFTVDKMTFTGNMRVVKEGVGTMMSGLTKQYNTGGWEIAAGTVKPSDMVSTYQPFGELYSKVIVRTGATYDMSGQVDTRYDFILDGGTIANANNRDIKAGWGCMFKITLTKDSALNATYSFPLWDVVDLNGYTLDVDIGPSKYLYLYEDPNSSLYNGTFTNGTVNVKSGGWFQFGVDSSGLRDMRTVDFKIGSALSVQTDTAVRNLTTSYCYGNADGSGRVKIYGVFTPMSDYINNFELQDGATLNLAGPDGIYDITSSLTGQTLRFAEDDQKTTIYVDVGDRKVSSNQRIVAWAVGKRPNVKFCPAIKSADYGFVAGEDGLYVVKGLIITFR